MLPYMDTKPFMRPTVRTQFRGLNNNLSAQDGDIVWMENMSSREYPLLANRKQRVLATTALIPFGMGARDALYWVSGTKFYYNETLKGTVSASDKQFAAMGNMILIFPDKKYFNTINLEDCGPGPMPELRRTPTPSTRAGRSGPSPPGTRLPYRDALPTRRTTRPPSCVKWTGTISASMKGHSRWTARSTIWRGRKACRPGPIILRRVGSLPFPWT